MVHALNEIKRALAPNGILIDLRPMLDHWPVEVVSVREIRKIGRMQDFLVGLEEDEVANQAIAQAEQNQWFRREAEEFFSYAYSWDTPSEMEEWIKEEWHEFIALDETDNQSTRSAWAVADADARVRVKMKMLIARWRKMENSE